MMEIYTTATFDELFVELPKKIQNRADEKTELFRENPFNPILRTEKRHPKGHDVWSFRVDLHYRKSAVKPRPSGRGYKACC
jgi:mRNA-degrading endonuclease RelE of RelBE toxin-antitoxin system